MAFVYKNVPAFELSPGEALAFDLSGVNDVDIQLDIGLAPATTNGGDAAAQPFQTVVTSTQTPTNPRGDTIVGNFELRFAAESAFSFPGGGLIIRFTNPSASYQLDGTCTETLTAAQSTDTSGFFVKRGFTDADGQAPWDQQSPEAIGSFQIGNFAPPAQPEPQPEPVDSAAPTTTITKGPKDKTTKKKATFEFSGTDTRAVASFQCSLDGAGFASCTSPYTVNVKKGKHTFQVRAIDQAGNVGTPANDAWKRKKK